MAGEDKTISELESATSISSGDMLLAIESGVGTFSCSVDDLKDYTEDQLGKSASTATAAGTTTLTNISAPIQIFTGTTTQTVVLPNATTLRDDKTYRVINTSTGNLTVNYNGGALAATIQPGAIVDFKVLDISTSAGTWLILIQNIYIPNQIITSVNASDPNNDIDFAIGNFAFSTKDGVGILATAMTKRTDATWAAGTNQGGMASGQSKPTSGTIHCFALSNAIGSVIDVGFDTVENASNLLASADVITAGLTKYKRVWSIRTNASQNNKKYVQNGSRGYYVDKGTFADEYLAIGSPGTTKIDVTLQIPAINGIYADFIFSPAQSSNGSDRFYSVKSSLDADRATVGGVILPATTDNFNVRQASGDNSSFVSFLLPTNNGQIWYRSKIAGDGNTSILIITNGWIDTTL